MEKDFIELKGVKVHNLKNISLKIPKNKLVVICGISGSGKSSLAFDYLPQLQSTKKQFLPILVQLLVQSPRFMII